MNPRSHLEYAFGEMIDNKDIKAFTTLTLLTAKQLESFDIEGRTFLQQAIESRYTTLAKELFELQKDNPNIIFSANNAEQTLLFSAIAALCVTPNLPDREAQHYIYFIEHILKASQQIKSNESGYKIWRECDKDCNTPLHLAADFKIKYLIELLLEQENNIDEKINYINRFNNDSNTPLHLACVGFHNSCDMNIVNLLIHHGADLTFPNKKNQTPIQFLINRELESQCELLLLLKDKQELFLSEYLEYAKNHHLDNEEIFNNYQILIELRDKSLYENTVRTRGTEITKPNPTPSFLSEGSKLLDTEWQIKNTNNANTQVMPMKPHQIFQENLAILREITDIADESLKNLNNQSQTRLSNNTIMYASIWVILIVSFIAIEAWLVITEKEYLHLYKNQSLSQADRMKYHDLYEYYANTAGFFGLLSGVALLFYMAYICLNKRYTPRYIADGALDGLTSALTNNLLLPLNGIQAQDMPISPELAHDLKTNKDELAEKEKTVTQAIHEVKRTKELIASTEQQMKKANKPFTLFHKYKAHEVIEMQEACQAKATSLNKNKKPSL